MIDQCCSRVRNDEYVPMIIDIKIVLNAAPFQQRYPNSSQNHLTPTEIEQEEAFVVAAPKQNVYRHASDKLELVAGKWDMLRWHASLTAGDVFHVILYRIIAEPTGVQLTTTPEMVLKLRSFPVPDTADPTQYTESQRVDAYFQCEVEGYGTQYYRLLFYIVERNEVDGSFNTVGYFSWKSMIVIRELQV